MADQDPIDQLRDELLNPPVAATDAGDPPPEQDGDPGPDPTAASNGQSSTTLLRPLTNCQAAIPARPSAQGRSARSPTARSRHASHSMADSTTSAPIRCTR